MTPDVSARIRYDAPVELAPGVIRLTQENKGLFSGPGTNTHIVGSDEVLVVDPGEDRNDGHLERILAAVDGRPVHGILPSHGHPDHWPLAMPLRERLRAPVLFATANAPFTVDQVLDDEQIIEVGGTTLTVMATPGHARDHLSLYWPDGNGVFCGDHVMGWSTTIIAPPDGNLNDYMRSLERLLAVEHLEVLYSAHGPAITEPYDRMREIKEHREQRTQQALAVLEQGDANIESMVREIYADVDPQLHPAAARSLWAHLLALEEKGSVERRDVERDGDRSLEFEAARQVVWKLAHQ